jgi:uncharacterized DUF497 family protein
MDEHHTLKGLSFVWDAAKARSNLSKHGVAFTQATEVFFDPFMRVTDAGVDDEARDAVIGMDEQWNLFYVVHIAFEDNAIRIISARKATPAERKFYEH